MTKSELIEQLIDQNQQLSIKDVELAVKTMLDHMTESLSEGERIEIRGFGSFCLHYRAPRVGRNQKPEIRSHCQRNMCLILNRAKICASR